MAQNPREILDKAMKGMGELGKTNGELMNGFMGFAGALYKPGALDTKTKELISVSIAVYARCEYCIVMHVCNALKAGATRTEIMEAGMVSTAFGAGPALAYSTVLLKDAIDEFAPDFDK